MQIMLTRVLSRDYDSAMVFSDKCHINLGGDDGSKGTKSDRKTRRELEWIYSQIAPTKDDDKDPDAHAMRLKLFLLSEESGSEFGDLNMVGGDFEALDKKRPHLSVCTRLTREEEIHIHRVLEDPEGPWEEATRPSGVYSRGGGGAIFARIAHSQIQSSFNSLRQKGHIYFDRAMHLKSFEGTAALKLMIAMTNDDGLSDNSSRANGGFLFLYAILVGEITIKVAGRDCGAMFVKLVLHWMVSFLEAKDLDKSLIKVVQIMLRLKTEGALERFNFPPVPSKEILCKDYPGKRGDHRHYGEDGALNFYTYFFKPHEKWTNSEWYAKLLKAVKSAERDAVVKKITAGFSAG